MQNDAADELHVEVHHVPGHRLIADLESVLALRQPARRIFYDCERFRQNLVELRPLILQLGNCGEFVPSRPPSSRADRRRRAL